MDAIHQMCMVPISLIQKSWTLLTNQMISHAKLTISITDDRNTINMTEHVTTITQIVSDEPSMLYPTVNDDDDEIGHSDEDYVEEELQTLVNPVTENTVTQWESSQWFNSARYDYTQFGASLNIDLGSPIDDLVESGTLRLLD
ncbi:hypothetical protein M9H77_28448 [Catharanthus roseus]|uniref:Uncharacterized protein n=1 Tax=Catharanthus roseus TaxID=4058 RepID=A0ACC0AH12_CATRO|nr:hypothetical protein M9H77_00451 [Catharanthus roseus]KAI5659655.1 hypothetical protein M9H77_28448 [Catharanthus roseus]